MRSQFTAAALIVLKIVSNIPSNVICSFISNVVHIIISLSLE